MKKLIAAVLLVAAQSASAVPVTWDFEELPDCTSYMCMVSGKTYSHDGFEVEQFYKANPDASLSWFYGYRGTASPAYVGKELGLSTQYSYLFTKADDGLFSIDAIDLRGAINSVFAPINLIFTATYADGSSSTQYFQKSTSWTSLESFASSAWTNLISLKLDNDGAYSGYQSMGIELSQVIFSDAVAEVPEPSTLAILGLGLAAAGFARRSRLSKVAK